MPLSTGILTQRSAVVLLSNVTFENNPNNIDGQQQLIEGGSAVTALDSSIVYIKNSIVFNLNADTWFDASYNSTIAWISDFELIITNTVSDFAVVPFRLYSNSVIDLQAGEDFGLFTNNSNITNQQLFTEVQIDTSSSLYINDDLETDIKQDIASIKGSLNNIFYSGGEPYVEIDSTGSLPEATGDGAISIGGSADATGERSIAIGRFVDSFNLHSIAIGSSADAEGDYTIAVGSSAEATAENSIAIGKNSAVEHVDTIAIGRDASDALLSGAGNVLIGAESKAGFASNGIAIGFNSQTQTRSVDIGFNTNIAASPSNDHIAIGSNVEVWGENSIGIGTSVTINTNADNAIAIGLNSVTSTENSISIGTSAQAEALDNVVIGNNCQIASGGDRGILLGSNIDLEGGESGDPADMIVIGSDITIGSGSAESIVIGKEASTTNVNTISIGSNSLADSADSIAIGSGAVADAGAAIQLGQGTNSNTSTLQLFNSTLANSEGLYTSYTNPTNYTPTDTDNVTSHFEAIDTALGNSAGSGGEPYVEINLTSALPTFTDATESLNIGSNVVDSGDNLLSIGNNNTLGAINGNDSDISKVIQIGFDNEYTELFFGGSLGNSVQIGVGNENANSSWDLVQIGYNNTTNGSASNSYILGSNCLINNNGSDSIALGSSAIIANNVVSSLQIGAGTNSTSNTVQFKDTTIANSEGIQAPITTGNNLNSPPLGSIYVDDTNGSERICVYLNGAWKCSNLT